MMRTILRGTLDVLSSYALAVVLILLLGLLTYLGTLEQVDHGLFEVQRKYFESFVLVHWIGGVFPMPLPGVYLILVVLTVNLILGGIVRMRRTWSRLGIYIAHAGILILMAGSALSFATSEHGHLTLFEGESSDEFVSHFEWELAIYSSRTEAGKDRRELLVPEDALTDLDDGGSRTFRSAEMPFEVTVRGWLPNCRPGARSDPERPGVPEYRLERLPLQKQAEANVAGAYATVKEKDTGRITEGLLWGEPPPPFGRQIHPLLVTAGGRKWAIDLRKKRRTLPFTITLTKFHHELYPRTGMPKVFRSDVVKAAGDVHEERRIEMNQPLREKGYTLYQSNWGPQGAPPGTPLFSGFSVVRNPADQWPLVSMIVTILGLLIHFVRKLFRYLRAQATDRRRTLASSGARS